MRYVVAAIAFLVLGLGAAEAQAQSCSYFVTLKSYDVDAKTIKVKYGKGNQKRFFPKPEGAPSDTTKVPKKCSKRITKSTTVKVKPTGGRMSVTQLRSNFEGRMLNDPEDAGWFKTEIDKLITGKTQILAVLRPGKGRDDMPEMTTLYLPITDAEVAEIARIDAQAEEVE